MTWLRTILRLLADPTVRAIVIPLAQQVAEWVRGGKRPEWLDGAVREVPSIQDAVDALAEARRRARR